MSGRQALATAERLLNPDDVLIAAPGAAQASLASGLAGTALLRARLSAVDPAFATAAIRHWTVAAEHAHRHTDRNGGTFSSAGGVAASLIIGSGYLPDPDPQRDATTRAVRWLSAGRRPGWWTPASEHPPTATIAPSGVAITGMAHGIGGPLAALATAHTAGYSVTGQRTAIQHAAQWLLHWRTTATSDWPPYVTGDELDSDVPQPVLRAEALEGTGTKIASSCHSRNRV